MPSGKAWGRITLHVSAEDLPTWQAAREQAAREGLSLSQWTRRTIADRLGIGMTAPRDGGQEGQS